MAVNLLSRLDAESARQLLARSFAQYQADQSVVGKARKVSLQPGGIWAEAERGTNAIGTALVERTPVVIHRSECRTVPPASARMTMLELWQIWE